MKALRKLTAPPKKLRARAERLLATTRRDIAELPVEDVQKLVHQLQVHQIELEMQNEELRRMQLELEAARDRYEGLYDFAPTALLTVNAHSEILEANLHAAKLLGLERNRLLKRKFTSFIAAESQDACHLLCHQVFGSETRQNAELDLVNAQHRRITVQVEVVSDATSSPKRCRLSLTDITERKRTEELRKESESQLRSFVEQAPAAIAMFDRNMNYLAASGRWQSDFHPYSGDLIGRNHYELNPDIPDRWKEAHRRGLAGESLSCDEDLWLKTDGTEVWLRWSVNPWLDARGNIGGILILAEDISRRKQAEKAARLFQTLANQSSDTFEVIDPKTGRFLDVNENGPAELGCTRAEYLSLRVTDIDPTFSAANWAKLAKKISDAGSLQGEGIHRRKDGTTFPIEFNAKWISLDRDYIVTVVRDITERKRTEERIAQLNRAKEILGGVDHAIVHISDQRKLLDEICRVAVDKGGFKLAWFGMVAPDETVRPMAMAGATGYLKDIHVVTRDEPAGHGPVGTAIRENRPVVIEDIDRAASMIPWRARARKFGLRYVAAFPIQIAGKVIGAFQVYAPKADFFVASELELLTQVSDDISFALTVITGDDARKQAEAALHKSEARFKLIFDTVPVGIAFHTVHPDGIFTRTVNDAHLRICGITRKLHDRPETYLNITHPEDRSVQQQFIDQVNKGDIKQFSMEKRYLHPGGKVVWVNFLYQRETYPDGTTEELTTVVDITERKEMEESLRRSEQNLSNFFNQAPIGLLWLSASGTILRANQAQLNMIGYPAEEYLGRFFLDFCVEPNHVHVLLERLANRETVRNYPMNRRCKDGTIRNVLVDANSFWSGDQHYYSSIFMRDISDRVKLEREILEITDREHRRIAQDLHDGLGQLLAGTAYLAGTLRQKLAAKSIPEARQLGRIQTVINEAIEQTRSLSRGLHPVEPEPNGLMAALQTLAERTKTLFHVRCLFHCPRPVLIKNNATATHLFRIAQEAVTNAIKHGKPKCIEISLTKALDRINLAITDNGRGISSPPKKPGMGLRIMRYRARMIEGSLDIKKEKDGGTIVVCTVQLSEAGGNHPLLKASRKKRIKKD